MRVYVCLCARLCVRVCVRVYVRACAFFWISIAFSNEEAYKASACLSDVLFFFFSEYSSSVYSPGQHPHMSTSRSRRSVFCFMCSAVCPYAHVIGLLESSFMDCKFAVGRNFPQQKRARLMGSHARAPTSVLKCDRFRRQINMCPSPSHMFVVSICASLC